MILCVHTNAAKPSTPGLDRVFRDKLVSLLIRKHLSLVQILWRLGEYDESHVKAQLKILMRRGLVCREKHGGVFKYRTYLQLVK